MSEANRKQIGGTHYKDDPIEHWDLVVLLGLDYFQAQILRYTLRWKKKNGLEDLQKGQHYYQKYIEIEEMRANGLQIDAVLLARALLKLSSDENADEDRIALEESLKLFIKPNPRQP